MNSRPVLIPPAAPSTSNHHLFSLACLCEALRSSSEVVTSCRDGNLHRAEERGDDDDDNLHANTACTERPLLPVTD